MKRLGLILVVLHLASSVAMAQDPAMPLWDLYKQGQFEDIENQGKALLNTGTESGSILLAVGRSLADMQREDEALFFLQRAIASDQQKNWVYAWGNVYLGKCRYHLQEMDLARDAWILARDCGATAHATNEAVQYLKLLGLAETYDHWSNIETEHFSLHFSPELLATDHDLFAQQHEQVYDFVTAWFKTDLQRKIRFFVWSNKGEAHQAGMPGLGFTMLDDYTIHVHVEQTAGHEMTHLISHHAVRPKVTMDLINVGTAVYFDGSGRNWNALAKKARLAQALSRSTGDPVPLSVMALWLDWGSQTDDVAYPVAGAFVSMLIKEGGQDKFLEAFSNQSPDNFQAIYGADLALWISSFDARLND